MEVAYNCIFLLSLTLRRVLTQEHADAGIIEYFEIIFFEMSP